MKDLFKLRKQDGVEALQEDLKYLERKLHEVQNLVPRDVPAKADRLIKRWDSYSEHKTFNNPKLEKLFFSLKIKNHEEVYSLGHTMIGDIEKGEKVLAFVSDSPSQVSQMVLGYSAFIDYVLEKSILVISPLHQERFSELKTKFSIGSFLGFETYTWGNALTFIDYNHLQASLGGPHAGEKYAELVDSFDVVIIGLPSLQTQKRDPMRNIPLYNFINNLYVGIIEGKSQTKDVQEIIRYFESFHLKIKGLISEK